MRLTSTAGVLQAGEQGETEDLALSEGMEQVAIQVDERTDRMTSPVLRGRSAIVKMVSCRPCGQRGMMEFVELVSNVPIKGTIDAIRADPNTESVNYHLIDKYRASCIIVTKDSPVCSALSSTGSFCKSCALEMDRPPGTRAKWEVAFPGEPSLNSFLSRAEDEGISMTVREVEDPRKSRLLTFEQEEVVRTAEQGGYFEFPRRMSLLDLSAKLKKAPATLEEVLRRGESKIIRNHVMHQTKGRSEP